MMKKVKKSTREMEQWMEGYAVIAYCSLFYSGNWEGYCGRRV
jgi:hypothetical protein